MGLMLTFVLAVVCAIAGQGWLSLAVFVAYACGYGDGYDDYF